VISDWRPQERHFTSALTHSSSSSASGMSSESRTSVQQNDSDSGTTWRRAPIRTRTTSTCRPSACVLTTPAIASHSDSSCMALFYTRIAVILNLAGRSVNVDQLFASIEADRPGRDDVVYLERRGQEYHWRIVPAGGAITPSPEAGPEPDTWMSLSADWPADPQRLRTFVIDLLAELESMAARTDRCRWPLDEPWPHRH